ncbi:hypothetical protein CA830_19540 [Burkholderia multivorans]|nr:hypothetical protein CA830_19540 [Burkholderia multivorans]
MIGLVFGCAWLARRFGFQPARRGGPLKVVSSVAVDAKDSATIVEVGETPLVLGVAPGIARLVRLRVAGAVRPHAQEEEKVAALDAGADDYLTKPFGVSELRARIRAQLRRRNQGGANESPKVNFGTVSVDLALRQVWRDGEIVHLTPLEYRLLATLVRHAGRVLTHRQLLRDVWGPSHVESHHYLRIYMAHLRQKLERDPAQPEHIVTETGVGYRLVGAA